MSAGDKTASFALNLGGDLDDVSKEMAAELEALRAKIQGSNDAVKQMSASMRSLRGTTDEVKQAKNQLKGMIEAERAKVSGANLALLKQGTTYEKLADRTKKAEIEKQKWIASQKKLEESKALEKMRGEQEALTRGIRAGGGPLDGLLGRFESLKGLVGSGGGAMAVFAAMTTVAVGAILAFGSAVAAAGVSLVHWIVAEAGALRMMQIAREAFTGTAVDATHLGHQLDALAAKVSTPKEELAKLGNELVRTLSGTRVSGQGIVDTFNAVAMASDAMGATVGAKIQEIIERSKRFGRVQINPLELQGTGLAFKDVAGQLAKQLHIGVAQAQAELFAGRVKVDDAAKALRAAVEARFGKVNAAKMLDLGVQVAKLHEKLQALTAGVNLEPLLVGVSKLFALFDQSTVAGATLKTMITVIGNAIGPAFEKATPIVSKVFRTLELLALKFLIAVVKVGKGIRESFAEHPELRRLGERFEELTVSSHGLGEAIAFTAKYFMVSAMLAMQFAAALERIIEAGEALKNGGWKTVGAAIIKGIVEGIEGAGGAAIHSIGNLAEGMKDKFKKALGIHSPSTVFAKYGRSLPQGTERGVDDEAPRAQRAVDRMAPTPGEPGGRAAGAGARLLSAGRPTANLTIVYQGSGASGAEVRAELEDPRFLGKMTKGLEDLAAIMGVSPEEAPT